jgi:hypothetical protein
MRTLKVEFTEDEINTLVNQICERAENNEKCHEKSGDKFINKFNDELLFYVKVLINDECDSRYVSTDIQLITVEGFYPVESNINYEVEDKVNKALIAEFHKNK